MSSTAGTLVFTLSSKISFFLVYSNWLNDGHIHRMLTEMDICTHSHLHKTRKEANFKLQGLQVVDLDTGCTTVRVILHQNNNYYINNSE